MTSMELLSLIFESKTQQRERERKETDQAPPIHYLLKVSHEIFMDVSKFKKFLLKSLSFN